LVGSILDENRSNGLDVHAKIYVPRLAGYSDVFDRTANKARMDLELLKDPKGFLNYSGGDPDATLSVANQQEIELLKDPYLTRFYVNILHPAARAFEKVESGGILVDTEAFRELHADLQAESIRLVTEAKKILGGRIVAKHADETKPGGMNITKASLIKDYMFSPMGLNLTPQMVTEKTKEPSSSLDHLLMFKDVPEASAFVQLMGDYASCTKTQSTFVEGFLEHLRSDGRFHPSFWFFAGNKDEGEGGTNTGRLSCKGPAFQCMVGSTPVLTRKGYVRIDKIVSDEGIGHEVLTHTGNWRRVVGVYRNGVRPVFRVKLSSGHAIDCTGNHPVLTRRGWVKTEDLKIHDVCYHTRTPNPGEHVSDVLQLGSNEESLPVVHFEGLGELRRSRDNSLRTLAEVREFSGGHGGEARRRVVDRAGERERELRAWELQVGTKDRATEQSSKHEADHLERSNSVRGPVGESVRDHEGQPALSPIHWGNDAVCLETFQECEVVSIEALGQEETFDLTIDSCHSFVANGVVVHNTLPKHTKWAKRLRKCYIAPDGYVVMERDYSQGELKIVACVANETNMIEAYRNGMDLHALTSGRFAGYDYEAMMKLKKEDEATYDAIRQLGKAGNFGLLYGMGADGFWAYAVDNYGVKNFSLQDAAVFRTGFFEMYPALVTYHNTYKAMAKRDGKIYSPLGRVRHLPMINSSNRMERSKAERQAINSPIQATLSDLLLWTAAEEHAMGLSKLCPMFGACHDAAYSYVPEDRIDELVPQMLHVMENLPLEKVGWKPQLNFTADAKIGVNMAEMKKYVPV
jgi:DNA polymerase I-like protein with 3'-5' exonuclease and polymerase domains